MITVVKLAFDPEAEFGEMWGDDIARTLWLLWRPKFIVPVGFDLECVAIAVRIRKQKPTTAVDFVNCFPTLDNYWQPGDVKNFAPEALPYFTGEKAITWEYVKR